MKLCMHFSENYILLYITQNTVHDLLAHQKIIMDNNAIKIKQD